MNIFQHPTEIPKGKCVLFYDADCLMCNGFTHWVMERDTKNQIYIAPLLGQTSENFYQAGVLPFNPKERLDSVIVLPSNAQMGLTAFDAVAHLLNHWHGYQTISKIIQIIPKPIMNALYWCVAKFRLLTKIKNNGTCQIPTPEKAKMLLE